MGRRLRTVIAVGNQKGGVGKTTNAVHVAAALGERGYRCLVIDLDPSAGATRHLGVPLQSFAGTLELLTTDETPEALIITKKLPKRVHLIPSRPQLSELDSMLSKFDDKTQILERPLKLARRHYDFIFLDTPPSAGATTTVAAYSSADWFLLSVFPHPLSLSGLNEALKDIADVRQRRNPELEILGVILSCVDTRTRMAAELESVVAQSLPGRAFQTVVAQYRRLAAEVEYRVHHREAFLEGVLAPLDLATVAFVSESDAVLDVSSDEEEPDAEEMSLVANE